LNTTTTRTLYINAHQKIKNKNGSSPKIKMALRIPAHSSMIRVMTNYGFRVYVTRAAFERAQRRAALASLLTLLLPLAVLFLSSALASTRHALASV
jgi:hypothetical protein